LEPIRSDIHGWRIGGPGWTCHAVKHGIRTAKRLRTSASGKAYASVKRWHISA
jgi:hypothetical protein